jgi:hypothetical protein
MFEFSRPGDAYLTCSQISREVIDKRYAEGSESRNDMLGSFKKHGLTADDAETEISISL